MNNDRILFISDMHIPYHHPDTVAFLTKVKEKYRPTRVVSVGDEVDKHAMSFHDSDPDLPSAGDELIKSINHLKPIYKLFPVMDLVDSNHGSLAYRKAKASGMPKKYIREYGEVLEAPEGWKWHMDLKIILPNGEMLMVYHGISKNIIKAVKERGVHVIQGHYHTEYNIQYVSTPEKLLWGMQVGCSIDGKALAFAYNKTQLARPVIGHGVVINGYPRLLPMVLNSDGRWNGEIV